MQTGQVGTAIGTAMPRVHSHAVLLSRLRPQPPSRTPSRERESRQRRRARGRTASRTTRTARARRRRLGEVRDVKQRVWAAVATAEGRGGSVLVLSAGPTSDVLGPRADLVREVLGVTQLRHVAA